MIRTERGRLVGLMFLHLLWGAVLWFSISKYGLGVSTDSVQILFGARNWSEGRGLLSYDGSFLVLWPPFYALLLGLVHAITRLDMLTSANAFQVIAFLALSVTLAILFLRAFPGNLLLAVAATILGDVGAVMLIGFGMVGSDYLGLMLSMLAVLLTALYLDRASPRAYVALALVGMLSMLTRYLGLATIAAAVLAVLWLGGGPVRTRLLRGAVLCLGAAPALAWWTITSRQYSLRGPISFGENFSWFSRSILEWMFDARGVKRAMPGDAVWLWLVFAGLIVGLIILQVRLAHTGQKSVADSQHDQRNYLYPILLYGVCYALALFGSAAAAYFNKLAGRFLLPVYIPAIVLVVAVAAGAIGLSRRSGSRALQYAVAGASYAALVGLMILLLQKTVPLAIASHAEGAVGGENVYNTRAWRENPAIGYWLGHRPAGDYLLFSNDPDGASFIAEHPALAAPRRTSGPYSTEEYPVESYRDELFAPGREVYLLWIEPNPYPFYYPVQDLEAVAIVKPLFESEQGGVYHLTPRQGN